MSSHEAPHLPALSKIEQDIEALPPSVDKYQLQLQLQEKKRAKARFSATDVVDSIKTAGTYAIAAGAVFTLFRGVSEFRDATRERAEAPFRQALVEIASAESAARRASALAIISDYSEKDEFLERSGDGLSKAERVAMVFALQAIEEPSPALRPMLIEALTYDSTMLEAGLPYIVLANIGLQAELEQVEPAERSRVQRGLLASAEALGTLLHELPEGQSVADALNSMSDVVPRGATLFLDGANLRGLDFSDLQLAGWSFRRSDVSGADLSRATLDTDTMLSLCSAKNLSEAKLSEEMQGRIARQCASEAFPPDSRAGESLTGSIPPPEA